MVIIALILEGRQPSWAGDPQGLFEFSLDQLSMVLYCNASGILSLFGEGVPAL